MPFDLHGLLADGVLILQLLVGGDALAGGVLVAENTEVGREHAARVVAIDLRPDEELVVVVGDRDGPILFRATFECANRPHLWGAPSAKGDRPSPARARCRDRRRAPREGRPPVLLAAASGRPTSRTKSANGHRGRVEPSGRRGAASVCRWGSRARSYRRGTSPRRVGSRRCRATHSMSVRLASQMQPCSLVNTTPRAGRPSSFWQQARHSLTPLLPSRQRMGTSQRQSPSVIS